MGFWELVVCFHFGDGVFVGVLDQAPQYIYVPLQMLQEQDASLVRQH
jgi:hypothetical protein